MLLLDTCTLLWLVSGGDDLSPAAKQAIRATPDELHISAISVYEIAVKHTSGKINLPEPPFQWFRDAVRQHRLIELPVTIEMACAAAALPSIHRDPFDRLIIAAAQVSALQLVTPDLHISKYPMAKIIW